MKPELVDGLEFIVAEPRGTSRQRTLLFVHGAFAGAWVWSERFLPLLAERGHRSVAISLRGHGESHGREDAKDFRIIDYVDDLEAAVAEVGDDPVLIGHSMGGFVVQKYLERRPAPAAVLLSSVPPYGLMGSTLNLAMRRPGLMFEINRLMIGANIGSQAVREALFASDVPDAEIRRHIGRMSPESQTAIWDMTLFNLVRMHAQFRAPTLVVGTEQDQLIPPFLVGATARAYGVEPCIVDGFGHAFMLERGSEAIASMIADWVSGLD